MIVFLLFMALAHVCNDEGRSRGWGTLTVREVQPAGSALPAIATPSFFILLNSLPSLPANLPVFENPEELIQPIPATRQHPPDSDRLVDAVVEVDAVGREADRASPTVPLPGWPLPNPSLHS